MKTKAKATGHTLDDCMLELGEAYEKAVGAVPGSGQWDSFDTAMSLSEGTERTVLPIWFSFDKKGKRGGVQRRKKYVLANFCPFCGKPISTRPS